MFYVIKVFVSALIIALVNEVSKRSSTLAALLLALPIVSVIAFTWEWAETTDAERIASLSAETFWFVLPTLPMFLVLAWLLRLGYNYYLAFGHMYSYDCAVVCANAVPAATINLMNTR